MVVTEEDLVEAKAVAETLTLEGVREVRQKLAVAVAVGVVASEVIPKVDLAN